ncbi:hypothetical protein CUZ95_0952 [Enterococcus lactis]|nr:hypothetical protein [Enterococcus lactis]
MKLFLNNSVTKKVKVSQCPFLNNFCFLIKLLFLHKKNVNEEPSSFTPYLVSWSFE